MAKKHPPSDKQLDDATIKTQLASKLIAGARNAAQMMGVPPGSWTLALIEEMARLIITQREAGQTVDEGLELVQSLLDETVEEMETNPRIEDDDPGVVMRVIPIQTITGPREADEVSELLARTIGKVER